MEKETNKQTWWWKIVLHEGFGGWLDVMWYLHYVVDACIFSSSTSTIDSFHIFAHD